jgi:subtilisin family serine protease
MVEAFIVTLGGVLMTRRLLLVLYSLAVLMTAWLSAGAVDDSTDTSTDNGITVAKSSTGSYVVVMEADPLIASYTRSDLKSPPAKRRGRGLKRGHEKALQDAGVSVAAKVNDYVVALNGFSAIMTFEQAKAVARQDSVRLVIPDVMRHPTTDSSPVFLGLTGPAAPWQTGVDGEGVVVGIIDSGIWPEHPSFADDGSFSAPEPLEDSPLNPSCEFGNTDHNPNDAPFECNNKLIGARQMLDTYRAVIGANPFEYDSARDDNGHGTHTASTAAGNAGVQASMYGIPRGPISGIAPRARVVAYKGLGTLGGFTSDLAAAIDQAVADGVDVINYSIGGGAAGPGADEIAFLFADAAGVFVATSAGNSGPGPASLGNPGTMPWLATVGANTQSRFFQGTVVLGDASEYPGASLTPGLAEHGLVDAEDTGGDLCIPGTLDPGAVAGKVVLCRRGAISGADKSLAVLQAGGAGMVLYNNSDDDNLFTDTHWVPSVHLDNTPGLASKAYIDSASDPTASINAEQLSEWPSAPSMTIFSSRGPNPVAPDIIKPDITGPGLQILAGHTPTPEPGSVPGELFQGIAGTSMSSPHIAGVFALIKQANPDWSPAMARSAIMTTASQDVVDNDRVSTADPFDMGSGHVSPGDAVHKGSAFQPGLVYDAGLFEYAAFTCGMDWGVFPPGSCAFLESIGVPTAPTDLNYPSIGIAELSGSQTVRRTLTSVTREKGWRTYNVSVDAPAGYQVTVSPSTLRLRRGDSATFEVTITNVSAPIGEWRFGAMTWSDTTGHYDVYSPIAVKAALFEAPTSAVGAGESGSSSFDVRFGYAGSYAAAAHGLEPAVITSDNVSQDPDQSFNPNDGFSNLHQFTLSGTAFLRIAMPPEATEANADLDIFVFDPNGNLAASSTAGGTDELIDIELPMDGTWDVYVHGWSTPSGDSDYDLFTWVISATPGGNLTIDAAPSSAVLGEVESIDVSWTGATAGEWHIGGVSHTGDVGLMGFTLIEVDNR